MNCLLYYRQFSNTYNLYMIYPRECFSIQVSTEQNSHVGMPHILLNVQMFMKVSNELPGFVMHFSVIFLANQMLVAIGLAHYDSKTFMCKC